jgi:DNA-binding MarR family transcriptional regulator
VRDHPGVSMGNLAEAMDIHQSTASNLVKALVSRQLVAVTRDAEDRRAVQLHVTSEGRKLLRATPGPFSGVLPGALQKLDAATLRRLNRDLGKLLELLGPDEQAARVPLSDL